jgi:hypothetical protein
MSMIKLLRAALKYNTLKVETFFYILNETNLKNNYLESANVTFRSNE